jgi:hypothetical protein
LNSDLSLMHSLRKVLESAEQGMGMAQSLVRVFRSAGLPGKDVARLTLLGFPLSASLHPLEAGESEEAAMLASLIVGSAKGSARLVGENGGQILGTLERWVKMKENDRLERKVLTFRALVASGILGAITAMVATLGPLLGSLGVSAAYQSTSPVLFPLAAAAMAAASSAMLGYYMSGRRLYVNLATSMAAFAFVYLVASPLANVTPVAPWVIK